MPRSTPRFGRLLPIAAAVIGAVTIVAVVGFGSAVLAPSAHVGDQTFAGRFSSDTDLRVTSLSIAGGHVSVGYSVEVLYLPQGGSGTIRCGIVDTSGRLDLFEGSRTSAPSGRWTKLEFDARYELPELTLGIRCSPNRSGEMSVVFRDAELHAVLVD